jgi:hypothetical protein
VQHPEVEGVTVCARCGRAGRNGRTQVRRRTEGKESALPAARPWLKPPHQRGE